MPLNSTSETASAGQNSARKFIKKPTVVEAILFDGRPESLEPFGIPANEIEQDSLGCRVVILRSVGIPIRVRVGDWIIKESDDTIYPRTADDFAAEYKDLGLILPAFSEADLEQLRKAGFVAAADALHAGMHPSAGVCSQPMEGQLAPLSIKELRNYLDGVVINSDTIGNVRRVCSVPWDSDWNGIVREETALRETPPTLPE